MNMLLERKPLTVPTKDGLRAWLVVALLCVVGCLNYLDRIMVTTMRDSITAAIPMTDAQFGLLTSVFLWVYGIFSPLAGFLADKFRRSRVIIISLFIWSAVTWLTAHAVTFEQLLATRALMGLSEACYIPAALALIADYHGNKTRSLANGVHMAGVMVGQSLGFLGGMIAEKHSWTDSFVTFGGIGIGYSLVLLLFLKDKSKQAAAPRDLAPAPATDATAIRFLPAMKHLFAQRPFWLLLIFWGFLGIVGWMILGWLPTYYREHFSLSQTVAGIYATGYMYPLSMAGVIIGGWLADRWSRKNNRGRIFLPLAGLCIAAPATFIGGSTDIMDIALAGFMTYAFMRVISDVNLMPILCMIINPKYIATGYGVLNMFACVVGGLGIYASGALRDSSVNMSLLFKIAAVLMALCAVILVLISHHLKKRLFNTR